MKKRCYATNILWLASLLLLAILSIASATAQIYKKTLDDGTVIYTDEKQDGSEPVQVEPVVTEFRSLAPSPSSAPVANDDSSDYVGPAQISIVSPQQQQSIRSNEGIVEVQWQAEVGDSKIRLHYELWVDSQLAYDGPATGVTLSALNRGEHRLQVRLFEDGGNELARSETVVVYIHKASVFNPALQGGGGAGD
ncbi:hypothetical protein [Pseudidiomarina sediminum]|uniref:hypothetical protein n=1 Tax=Pseudidiomarina sediminum TaxID=431675 RepID=UPI001C971A64|nr:hypothetical protein [Pseudidiomarina sediminum]MBY6064532.1 hypothetical protein [Pseudidiomarina sediminum]